MSPRTIDILHNITRREATFHDAIHLFPTVKEVDRHNDKCLEHVTGEEKVYRARKDRALRLKRGAPVMVTRNIYNLGVINGDTGIVKDFHENGVDVWFPQYASTKIIERYPEVRFVKNEKTTDVVMPLCLAFALTIHKAQGLTLPRVSVDCRQIFCAGQLGVAVGRVRSLDDIELKNFSMAAVPNLPESTVAFLEQPSKNFSDKCCVLLLEVMKDVDDEDGAAIFTTGEDMVEMDDDVESLSETDKQIIQAAVEKFTEETTMQELQQLHDIDCMKSSIKCSSEITATQRNINNTISRLKHQQVATFVQEVQQMLDEKFSEHCSHGCDTRNMTAFISETAQFWSNFQPHVSELFETAGPTSVEVTVASKIFMHVRTRFLSAKKRQKIEAANVESCSRAPWSNKGISVTSQKKVYYLAGRCIFKLRRHFKGILNRNARLETPRHLKQWRKAERVLRDMNVLEGPASDRDSGISSFTTSREYFPSALTHPAPLLFDLFLQIEQERLQFHSMASLKKYGAELFIRCEHQMLHKDDLLTRWRAFFPESPYQDEIYRMLVKKYLNIMHNQFRKSTRDKVNYEKKLANRAHCKGPTRTSTMSFEYIISSTHPQQCHEQMQEEINNTNSTFLQKLTVPQLIQLGQGYNLHLNKRLGKNKIITAVKLAILTSEVITNPEFRTATATGGPQSSTHSADTSIQQQVTVEDTVITEDASYPCPACFLPYDPSINSICCDGCEGWFHQMCSGLNDAAFEALSQSEDGWFCPGCIPVHV